MHRTVVAATMLRAILLAILLPTLALVAAPTASATVCFHDLCPDLHPGACVIGQEPCYQADLACVTNNGQATVCVKNPCGIPVRCFAASDSSASKCYNVGRHTVCVFSDEPEWFECVQIDGRAPVCVVDPCGTTACF
jgi:hypothetical protein